jgi:hypothetical protein
MALVVVLVSTGTLVSVAASVVTDTPARATPVIETSPAVWSLGQSDGVDPNLTCGQWLESTPPPGTVSATVVLSGAGGGGGSYDHGSSPDGGTGAEVSTQFTITPADGAVSVNLGCGGPSTSWSTGLTPPPGGAGYSDGGSINAPEASGGGPLYGGAGGGSSGLCLQGGSGPCTTPLVVAAGGGGAGGENDCLLHPSAGWGGSGWGNVATVTSGHYTVEPGAGGQTGNDGDGGDGGGAAGGGGGDPDGYPGGGPVAGAGGVGGQRDSSDFLGSGGGAGGGFAGGGGGGGDACMTGGAAGGGGGGGSSAIDTSYLVPGSDSFSAGTYAYGGLGSSNANYSTVVCPEDNNAALASGCPGYITLTWTIEPLVFDVTQLDSNHTVPASTTADTGPFFVHVRRQDGSLYTTGSFTISLTAAGATGTQGVDWGFAPTERGTFEPPGTTVTTSGGVASFWFGDDHAGDHVTVTASDNAEQCGVQCLSGQVAAPAVVPGPPAVFTVTGSAQAQVTASATADAGPFTVTVEDALGNPVTGGTYTVDLSATDAGPGAGTRYGFATTSGGAFQAGTPTVHTADGTATFWFGDENAVTPSLVASDPADQCDGARCTKGTLAGPQVVAGPASAFVITGQDTHATEPASDKASGGPYAVQVSDAFGNRVTTGTYTVTLSATGATGTAGSTYGFAAADDADFEPTPATVTTSAGTATFWFGDETAGDAPTLTASDAGTQCGGNHCTSATVTAPTVVAAPPTRFAFTQYDPARTEPASATATTGRFTVAVEDRFHNIDTAGSYTVTLSATGVSGTEGTDYGFADTEGGTFGGPPATITTVDGIGTGVFWFGDEKAGDHPVLTASDAGTQCGDVACSSDSVDAPTVVPGPPVSFVITRHDSHATEPGSSSADEGPYTVAVEDALGNLVTTGSYTVTLTASGASGTEGTNYGFSDTQGGAFQGSPATVTTTGGLADFYFGDEKAGDFPTITVEDTSDQCGGTTCAPDSVVAPEVVPGPATRFVVASQDQAAGTPASATANAGPFTVSVEDSVGNLVPTGSYTVSLTATGVTGTEGTTYGYAHTDGGTFQESPVTVTTSGGTATVWFGDETAGDVPTLVASDAGTQCGGSPCASTSVPAPPITAAAAHAFVLTEVDTAAEEPASATANGGPYQVSVEDVFGNLVTTGSYTVSLGATSVTGTEGTDYGFATAEDGTFQSAPATATTSGGQATFWFGDGTGGDHPQLTVSDGGTQCSGSACVGDQTDAPPISGATSFVIGEIPPFSNNQASDRATIGPGYLEVLDAQDQLVTAGTYSVTLTATGVTGTEGTNYGFSTTQHGSFLTAPTTVTTTDGQAVVWFGDETPDDHPVLVASDTGTQCGGVACTSSSVAGPTIAGSPSRFILTQVDRHPDEPASVVANGGPWTVSVEDRFGTVVADGEYAVTLTATGATGTQGTDFGFATAEGGHELGPHATVTTSGGDATFWFGDSTAGDRPTVVVSDSSAQCAGLTCSPDDHRAATIVDGMTVPAAPARATIGVAYSTTLSVDGGTAPYSWSIASGQLPVGLHLNGSDGSIAGTPSAVGVSRVVVRVLDARGLVITVPETLSVLGGTTPATGYWEVGSDGGIYTHGDVGFFGSMGGAHLTAPVVGMAATPSDDGYWEVGSDGGIFTFGDARFYGSMGGLHLNEPIVGMAPTPDGHGYWLVASDGGIFTFGDAPFLGSEGGQHRNAPAVGMAAPTGASGYWLIGADGGITTFGALGFFGSEAGGPLNAPVVGGA